MTVDAAVVGAGGATGRQCVEKLLESHNTVRAIVRHPESYKDLWPASTHLEIVKGDVTDSKSLETALDGAKGVIFAASGKTYFSANAVDKQGVKNVAEVAKRNGSHVVLITSALVTPKNRFNPIRIILNNIRWGLMDAKYAGEIALRESGVPFTIVRPGGLTNDPVGKAKLITGQGDSGGGGRVSRGDLAAVCVAALTNPKSKGITFELKSDSSTQPGPNELNYLFDNLQPGLYN